MIREVLRENELRIAEIDALRVRLIASENSGVSDRIPEEIRASVKAWLNPKA